MTQNQVYFDLFVWLLVWAVGLFSMAIIMRRFPRGWNPFDRDGDQLNDESNLLWPVIIFLGPISFLVFVPSLICLVLMKTVIKPILRKRARSKKREEVLRANELEKVERFEALNEPPSGWREDVASDRTRFQAKSFLAERDDPS